MVKQRDGAEQRDGEGSVEQETCEKMHVFEERVSEREENQVDTQACGVVAHSLVDPGRGWPRSSLGKEATLCCPSLSCSGRKSQQQRARLTVSEVESMLDEMKTLFATRQKCHEEGDL